MVPTDRTLRKVGRANANTNMAVVVVDTNAALVHHQSEEDGSPH
jgi:hypothetical protein